MTPSILRDRLGIASRVIAALVGSYAVAALFGIALATLLPFDPADAGMTATLLALVMVPPLAMACFWMRSAARVWTALAIGAVALAGIAIAGGWRV